MNPYVVLALNEVSNVVLKIFVLVSLLRNELLQLLFSFLSAFQEGLTEVIDLAAVLNFELVLTI